MKPQKKMDQDESDDLKAESANDEFHEAIGVALMEGDLGDTQSAQVKRAPSQDQAAQQCYHGFELPRSFRKHEGKLGDDCGSDDEKLGSFHFDCRQVMVKLKADVATQKGRTG